MSVKHRFVGLLAVLAMAASTAYAEVPHVKIGKYPQEVATRYTSDEGLPSDDVKAVHLGTDGSVWVETAKGWATLKGETWSASKAPSTGSLVGYVDAGAIAKLPDGVNQLAVDSKGHVVAATAGGLQGQFEDGFGPIPLRDGKGRIWATSDVRGVAFDTDGNLWVGTLAGVAVKSGDDVTFYTGAEGLPYADFTTLEAGPNGVMWFGTHLGAIWYENGAWHYRQGKRWLPNDDIRDIAVDAKGNAWFATAGGVGLIERRIMTLAEKADFYEEEMNGMIGRTPFRYFSEVSIKTPGDKKSGVKYHDSDNDGLWTAMYGAGECFAYAATKDPKAKKRAKRAFEALRHLQKVTQGGEHAPPLGYVARTILPTDGPDPNIGRLERDIEGKNRPGGDQLWKLYEPRWPTSADGKWFWKSDTSSDELDGHYFFYPIYYDLVADTEEEKERVREVVRDLTDHLIKYGYNLMDHDGTITRWGFYGPESLNHDFNWWAERGLKSLSMLSYLAVAEHVTGDASYGEHAQILRDEHAYHTNLMHYKIHRGIGSGNQSDDEMAFMSYYNLLRYEKDEKLREQYLLSFYTAWAIEQPEMNPFFNFAYAACALGGEFTNPWGTHPVDPWEGWLEDSMETLKGFPLDRLNWASKNSHRLDIVKLPRQQAFELTEDLSPRGGGYRVNDKVIPVENRFFHHWNSNPWSLDYGGNGTSLGSGTVFLLPYYMGLYHGFIVEE
jgi:hypothetical protein